MSYYIVHVPIDVRNSVSYEMTCSLCCVLAEAGFCQIFDAC